MSRSVYKTKKKERNVWVYSLACLYLLRYVKPDASIIQSTALRRSPTRDTLLRVTCAHDTTTAMCVHACVYSDEDGRGTYRHVRSCSRISRIVPEEDGRVTSAATLTWPPGWRVGLTLSEICAARYLSSWRFRPECLTKRHLFPFFTPHKKIFPSFVSYKWCASEDPI